MKKLKVINQDKVIHSEFYDHSYLKGARNEIKAERKAQKGEGVYNKARMTPEYKLYLETEELAKTLPKNGYWEKKTFIDLRSGQHVYPSTLEQQERIERDSDFMERNAYIKEYEAPLRPKTKEQLEAEAVAKAKYEKENKLGKWSDDAVYERYQESIKTGVWNVPDDDIETEAKEAIEKEDYKGDPKMNEYLRFGETAW
jgi:hypothetical protein